MTTEDEYLRRITACTVLAESFDAAGFPDRAEQARLQRDELMREFIGYRPKSGENWETVQ